MSIKIPVDADIRGVQKKIEELAKTVEKANRVKWTPIDSAAIDKESQKLQSAFRRRYGMSIGEAKESGRFETISAGGRGRGGGGGGGRDRFGRSDFGVSDIGRSFASGVGGGFQTITGYAARGAAAGAAEGGGGVGGTLGLLRGLGIGTAVFAAMKAGQFAGEGIDMAKGRAQDADVLKRQMGDVGISFQRLKDYADKLSDGLGVNSQEFIKLESNLQKLSRTTESPESLAKATAFGVGVSRSYGLEAGAAGNFFGGMRNIDPRQNNRELALILADTIGRTGMNARADEVMQSILNFTSTASRMSLSSANPAAFGSAYSDLVGTHLPGMTPENASAMLMQANAGVTSMGAGAGEAGRAFMLSAFNRGGQINPIQAEALAQGGLFGSRASVFGQGAIRQFIGDKGMGNLAGGSDATTSNFDTIRNQVRALGGNKWFQLEGAQRLFGMQSLSQTAALMNLPQGQGNQLMSLMQSNNLDINKFSASGISRLGSIAGAGTDRGKLSAIFEDMKNTHVLSGDETRTVSAAEKASPAQFRDALIKVASMKDQADDQGENIRTQTASLENIKINTGDKLLNPIIAMSDTIVAAMGRGPQSTAEKIINLKADEAEDFIKGTAQERRTRQLNRHDITKEQAWKEIDKIDADEKAALALQEKYRSDALHQSKQQYEIHLTNNVNVSGPNGPMGSSSTRTNLGAPQAAGSKSVAIGTH